MALDLTRAMQSCCCATRVNASRLCLSAIASLAVLANGNARAHIDQSTCGVCPDAVAKGCCPPPCDSFRKVYRSPMPMYEDETRPLRATTRYHAKRARTGGTPAPLRARRGVAVVAALLALVPIGSEAKGYYNSAYGRTYYTGSTQYYFFYGGVRHYHGVRFWERCDGHCEQTVSVDQASFRVDYAYYNYRTTSDSELSAAATSALVAVWPMIKPELVTVIPSNVGGMHVAYTVFLPDGTNKDAFEETVRSCVERACSGETTCALVQPPGATELTTGEAKCPQTIEVAYTTVSAVAMPAAGTRKMEMEEEFEGGLRWWVWVVIVLCCMCCAVVVGGEKSGGGASGGTNHYDTYALGQ